MYTHNCCVSSSQFGIMEHSSHVCVCVCVCAGSEGAVGCNGVNDTKDQRIMTYIMHSRIFRCLKMLQMWRMIDWCPLFPFITLRAHLDEMR